MSQKVLRKSQNATAVSEDKDKTDNSVKEMKKKVAANTEKEKQMAEKPAEKNDKVEPKPAEKTHKEVGKPEKPAEKVADKQPEKIEKNGEKKQEKPDKSVEKKMDKVEKVAEKKTDKPEKVSEKKIDKPETVAEKKVDTPVEKKAESEKKEDAKADKAKEKPAKPVNGTHNGAAAATHVTVSDDSDDELVIEEDELFPELTYDDSDTDAFDADAPSRSLTRRSQVKVTKTPETPRPASEKESEDSKESKLLKLKDDAQTSDRKLRSSDSPKRDRKPHDTPKIPEGQEEEKKVSASKKDLEAKDQVEDGEARGTPNVDELVSNEVESVETAPPPRAAAPAPAPAPPRSRARVSPYCARHEATAYSIMADYSGNNSTMEMDITESSSLLDEDSALNDSGYLRGLRGIRGRSSYKSLPRPAPRPARLSRAARAFVAEAVEATAPAAMSSPVSTSSRPTGTVVGRKRRPSGEAPGAGDDTPEVAAEAVEEAYATMHKRSKLQEERRERGAAWGERHDAEIVGINSDLPLTAPVASAPTFDPESLAPAPAPLGPGLAPLAPGPPRRADSKRCIVI